MIDRDRNRKINAALSTLYERYSAAYLTAYIKAFRDENPPERINEFGIIDEERYDADNGIWRKKKVMQLKKLGRLPSQISIRFGERSRQRTSMLPLPITI